jgi:hypothetical protein
MSIDGVRLELDADTLFAAPRTVQDFNSGSGTRGSATSI